MSRGSASVIGARFALPCRGASDGTFVVLGVPRRDADGGASRLGGDVSDDGVVAPSTAGAPEPDTAAGPPPWLAPTVRRLLWQAAGVVLAVWLAVALVRELRGLLSILGIALFFALAMEPAVSRLHARHGLSRSAATGVVFLAVAAAVAGIFFLLIPGITTAADAVGARLPRLLDDLRTGLGIRIGDATTGDEAAAQLEASVRAWLRNDTGRLVGLASGVAGLLFQVVTIATFTFYFAADAPRIRRGLLTRLPPARQQRLGWALDTAIEQTGGYFYSRLLLMIVNATLGFGVLVAVGLPWLVALPSAIFQGFFAEFIPAVGTYIGAAVPVVVTLGLAGIWPAVIVVVWVVVYQQVENVWLAPRLSARTMEVNGAVAFGAALAGGALGGPMGAFMALPLAALVTAFVRTYGRSYPLAYDSPHDRPPVNGSRAAPERKTIFQRSRR
jgi:predicted PurR-regulated permease PerM